MASDGANTLTDTVMALVAAHQHLPGALLPLLHEVQSQLGHVPEAAVPPIAQGLQLSAAEVHGVLSYYPFFRRSPPGRQVVQVCCAESCRTRGADALLAQAEQLLGCPPGTTRADRAATLLPVYCLGLCAQSPALQLDDQLHAHATPALLQALLQPAEPGNTPGASTPAAADTPRASTPAAADTPTPTPPPAAVTVFVPRDAAALAVGADTVATALQAACSERGWPITLVRNGSRGLLWLEPLLEVQTPAGRVAYGPVTPQDIPTLLDAGLLHGGAHPLCHGLTEQMPYLARQTRLTLARLGVTDPLSLADYAAHGGWAGLRRALALGGPAVVDEVTQSGLRGRGGAGFPAGIKWRTVADTADAQKYVVCNADEGDSGTFSDRMTMEGDPFLLIEGMAIAALAVGASQGYVYGRSEYPHALAALQQAIGLAQQAGVLGEKLLGTGPAFQLEVRRGAGSYVCGEETALLNSLEGKRGVVRAKPPLPAVAGLFGQPTLVHNVITLASAALILARGAAAYRQHGVGQSRGTLPFQLAGNIRYGGLVEAPFGITLRQLVFDFGGGTASGRPVKAVQVGGPLGAYVPASQWDVPLDYEAYAAMGASLGHGGIVVHDDSANLATLARHALAFCAQESCGQCTPCRIGSTRGVTLLDRITDPAQADTQAHHLAQLRELCHTLTHASLCAMGGMTPAPVLSALQHYPQDFGLPLPATTPTAATAPV